MNRSPPTGFDGRGWRSEIAERLDRPTLVAALALATFWLALWCVNQLAFDFVFVVRQVVEVAAFEFVSVFATLLPTAAAIVAVHQGASRWVAYPLAAAVAVAVGLAAAFAIDPLAWFVEMKSPSWATICYIAMLFAQLLFPAILYVHQSSALRSASALRRLETERRSEAERLADQRLQTELATIDHDVVLTVMRLALSSPPAEAQGLLAAVSTYLRVAQQRNSSDPQGIATALGELRQICAKRVGRPTQRVAA